MTCGITRILTLKEAIHFFPLSITDLQGNDMTSTYMYSWSTDGACWTNWVEYSQYLILAANVESDFYLRILVTGGIGELKINGVTTTCYNVCMMPQGFCDNPCDNPNLFQPYAGLDCALLLQQQLADMVICMFGIPVYYFRCDPDKSSSDFTFKEFVMHNVVDCKQLKLMVQDGQMPSSNPQLTEMDFEWEIDWETELSKTQFANAFGDTAIPKARDFLYIPLMKRMWEVNAAYDEKNEGLMWRSTTWKLALVKYQDSTNVLTDGFDAIIDDFIVKNYQNTFGELEGIEQERESGFDQVEQPKFAATNLYNIFMEDAIRKQYTKDDASVLDKIYCHNNNIVARNIYKFKNENGCITYQKGMCGDCGTISMLIETGGTLEGSISKNIAEFGPIDFVVDYSDGQFILKVEDLEATLLPFSAYLVIFRWNRSTFTKELSVYKHIHRTDMPVYILKPEHFWFDIDRPVAELTSAYNNDYNLETEQPVQIHPWPLSVTNIKLYNRYLDHDDAIKETLKYTTTDPRCVFADLARPINSGQGYAVR
jgi:hypothetical protein